MINGGQLDGGERTFNPDLPRWDQRTGFGHDVDYTLTPAGEQFLTDFDGQLPPRRPVIRYCIDGSEQRHLAGALGQRTNLEKLTKLQWVRRTDTSRAVQLTESRVLQGLTGTFVIQLNGPSGPSRWGTLTRDVSTDSTCQSGHPDVLHYTTKALM